MGIVFYLYKRKPKERYELGKSLMDYRKGDQPRGLSAKLHRLVTVMSMIKKPFGSSAEAKQKYLDAHNEFTALSNPGHAAIWSIMETPNYSVFKVSKWTHEELTDKIWRGSDAVDTKEQASVVAAHLLAWAGDADVTLNADEQSDLSRLNWPTTGYHTTGSIWEALK